MLYRQSSPGDSNVQPELKISASVKEEVDGVMIAAVQALAVLGIVLRAYFSNFNGPEIAQQTPGASQPLL